ncbi:MAG: histidine kinase, partial [Deltaproteobacteria bacterium]|nr:histidine kinase [Deltaproteobacteria bacterium]
KYIKVSFLRGSSLRPLPPVESKDPNTRYFHIHEADELDEVQWAAWLQQAAALPGWVIGKAE